MKVYLKIIVSFIFLLSYSSISGQVYSPAQKTEMCEKIKDAAIFAWNGYKEYAWGYDALKPLSNQGRNWYSTSLVMTPVDAYDTFVLLGMEKQAEEAKNLIFSNLNFDINNDVQVFEITIRLLGGLQSSYELSGDKRFLTLAKDIGNRLMPAFNSPTGMPYRYVNLQTGETKDSISNPAEIGTLFLEFGKLTQLTGDSIYFKAAKKAILAIYERRSKIDLVGTEINIETGEWTNPDSHIGGMIDSYYEYLFKGWLLFGDMECKYAWDVSNAAVKKILSFKTDHGIYFGHADMNTGKAISAEYGALEAFYAGLLALSRDLVFAKEVQQANYYMWTKFNIEPEVFDFKTDSILYPSYPLRPENIESCFYLYRFTNDDQYLKMGGRMITDILEKCKTSSGFAAVKNVTTYELSDSMESFFYAETLKYAWLLFAPLTTLDLKTIVFNTEAHPFHIMDRD